MGELMEPVADATQISNRPLAVFRVRKITLDDADYFAKVGAELVRYEVTTLVHSDQPISRSWIEFVLVPVVPQIATGWFEGDELLLGVLDEDIPHHTLGVVCNPAEAVVAINNGMPTKFAMNRLHESDTRNWLLVVLETIDSERSKVAACDLQLQPVLIFHRKFLLILYAYSNTHDKKCQ
jgi:hypothetical protein